MKRIYCIVIFQIFIFTLGMWAQKPVTDALVHEIITECVSKTGGFIIQDKIKEDKDHEVQIALPENINHYEISKLLKPLMVEIEEYYYSAKPWKVLDNGYLCNFNLAKDGSNRTLSLLYLPNEHILYVSDSPTNSPKLSIPLSFITKLQNGIVWGTLNSVNGFIREEMEDKLSPQDDLYQVAIQLQENTSPMSIIEDLKPITSMLEQMYYLAQPWQRDDKGTLECEFFAQLKEYKKNMSIHFYFFPKPNVLVIDFITGDSQ